MTPKLEAYIIKRIRARAAQGETKSEIFEHLSGLTTKLGRLRELIEQEVGAKQKVSA